MTFLSLAEGSRRLGVDPKTLRRWLSLAHVPVASHPGDGRLKGVTSEHLELVAHLHHRRLAPLTPEPPAFALPALPATLLALPEQLGALQTQLAVLQQQVAALTALLQQQAPSPGSPAVQAQPSRASKRLCKPGAPCARPAAAAAAKPPRKPVHVIPRVEYVSEGHYVVICPKQGMLPFEPETPEWFVWLAQQSSFRFVGKDGHFTAHHEWRVPRGAWRAHRHIRNHNVIVRLAPTNSLTIAVLEQAASALQAHLT